MALNVGKIYGSLDLDDASFMKKLAGAGDGMIGKLTTAARMAAVGMSAALVAGAAKSVMAFADFEQGMNEVFTLLPGVSQEAMDKMSGQVKDLAVDFGVMPDTVIPALYQALSAGVPPDNVFDFMTTAAKAAKGGATDLETAVDGITSAVNAYGKDVLSAEQASDLMFTAVRMGKTTFAELSQSLFQVNPVASALGVEFGDVTAALATMTAQGVPTSVATTQMRQMFVELSDAGTQVSQTFQQIAGKSFKDFIAEGGNTQQAMQMLEQYARDSGVGVNELFGSVEAGSAALTLTGKGTETFTGNLQAMNDAAGATEGAYQQMSGGLGQSFDKLKATGQVFLVNVGDKLAPVVQTAVDAFLSLTDSTPGLIAVLGTLGAMFASVAALAMASAIRHVAAWVVVNASAIAGIAVQAVNFAVMIAGWVASAAAAMASAVVMAAAWFIALGPIGWVIAAVVGLVALIVWKWDWVKEKTRAIWTAVSEFVGTAWGWIREKISGAVNVISTVISSVLVPIFRTIFNVVSTVIGVFMAIAGPVVSAVIAAVGWLIEKLGFLRVIFDIIGAVVGAVGGVLGWLNDHIFQPLISGAQSLWDKLSVLSPIFDAIGVAVDLCGRALGWLNDHIIQPVIGAFQTLWDKVIEVKNALVEVKDAVGGALGSARDAFGGAVEFVVPGMASGGIVTRPTLAVVGEAGPEAVIPLSKLGSISRTLGKGGRAPSAPSNVEVSLFIDPAMSFLKDFMRVQIKENGRDAFTSGKSDLTSYRIRPS